jgi:ubiquitin-protein ligase
MTTSIQIITKDTIRRLLKDIKQIINNPLTDNGIYYSHDEVDMLKGYAMIIGPADTPYFGGFYFFKFQYPCDYPFSPPKVTYMTNNGLTRFNPNLYKCGKVCVSILNTWSGDKWSSCQTVNSVLLTLCSLLNNAPLENEPHQNKQSPDFIPYQKSIEYCNIDFAICSLINNTKKIIPTSFEIFYPFMREKFLMNYDKLHHIVTSKTGLQSVEIVKIYSMTTVIDYAQLKHKLEEVRAIVEMNTTFDNLSATLTTL